VLERLQAIRRTAAVAIGLAPDDRSAAANIGIPGIGFVAPPADAPTLSGDRLRADQMDLTVRFLSNGQPHRALPVTSSLCTSIATRIPGTLPNQASGGATDQTLRLGMPSGILTVDADVTQTDGAWTAHSGTFYRTARRLFDGRIYVPV
jgi:2-methylaconitate isomerase